MTAPARRTQPPHTRAWRPWQRYLFAVLMVGAAVLVRTALQPELGTNLPFPTFFIAMIVTAWFAGPRPAILAFVLGLLAADYFFIPPYHSLALAAIENLPAIFFFSLVSSITLAFAEAQRAASQRAEESEASLRVSEQRVSTILRSIGDAVIATDAEGKVSFLNPVAEQVTGWREKDATGEPLRSVFQLETTGGAAPADDAPHALLVAGTHGILVRRDGTQVPVEGASAPMQDAAGEFTGMVCVFRDVSGAERMEWQRKLLAETSAALGALLDADAILQDVIRLATPRLADWASLELVDSHEARHRLTVPDDDPEAVEQLYALLRSYPPSWQEPGVPQPGEGERTDALWIADLSAADPASGTRSAASLQAVERLGARCLIRAPLLSGREVIGVLSLVRGAASAPYVLEDVSLAEELAARVAAAVVRTRLYHQVQDAQWRLAFLAEASAVFISSLDYDTTLANVARMAVPQLADWCAVQVLEPDGTLRQVALAHPDPEKLAWADTGTYHPPNPNARRGVLQVLRTGQSELYPEIPDDFLVENARSEVELERLRGIGLRSAIVVPIRAAGEVLGTIALMTAESGRRYTEVELANAEDLAHRAASAIVNARLYRASQESDQRKDQFLSMLAHELRNPLAPLLTSLHLVRANTSLGPEARRPLDVIERQVKQLTRLTNDLLDVSRITRGKMQILREPLDLTAMLRDVVEDHQPMFEVAGLHLDLVSPDELLCISGDRARLAQAVGNLLGNACKFTRKGGTVTVRVTRAGDQAHVAIEDTGVGISPELLPHVFETFMQADTSLDRSSGGLGLGLALVKGLMELHGGGIRAGSEGLGRGATFTLFLPLVPAPLSIPEGGSPDPSPLRAGPLSRNGHRERLKVLVIEDNPDAAESLQDLLSLDGYCVDVALSGPSGVEKAHETRPEVVLCDIGLPGMDGYEVARALRSHPHTAQALLVAITGYAQDEDRRKALEAGFDHHVAKPADPAILHALIAERQALLAG